MSDVTWTTPHPTFGAPTGLSARHVREEDQDYAGIVAQVSAAVRVVECRDGIQWIVQRLVGGRWRGVSFHRDRDVLIERSGAHGEALVLLEALPAWHVGGGQ